MNGINKLDDEKYHTKTIMTNAIWTLSLSMIMAIIQQYLVFYSIAIIILKKFKSTLMTTNSINNSSLNSSNNASRSNNFSTTTTNTANRNRNYKSSSAVRNRKDLYILNKNETLDKKIF